MRVDHVEGERLWRCSPRSPSEEMETRREGSLELNRRPVLKPVRYRERDTRREWRMKGKREEGGKWENHRLAAWRDSVKVKYYRGRSAISGAWWQFFIFTSTAQPLFLLHKWKQEELCSYVNYGSATEMASASLATLVVSPLVRSDGIRKGRKRKRGKEGKAREERGNENKIKIVGERTRGEPVEWEIRCKKYYA